MEEVWEDINLSSLHDHNTTTTTTATGDSSRADMAFQDFLTLTPNIDQPRRGPSSSFPSFSKRRTRSHEIERNDDEPINLGDLRHTRMMKNRESAARSRARRQAYTNELELKVARLTEENARLRKHQVKLLQAAPDLPPKKQTLTRTLTAPF